MAAGPVNKFPSRRQSRATPHRGSHRGRQTRKPADGGTLKVTEFRLSNLQITRACQRQTFQPFNYSTIQLAKPNFQALSDGEGAVATFQPFLQCSRVAPIPIRTSRSLREILFKRHTQSCTFSSRVGCEPREVEVSFDTDALQPARLAVALPT